MYWEIQQSYSTISANISNLDDGTLKHLCLNGCESLCSGCENYCYLNCSQNDTSTSNLVDLVSDHPMFPVGFYESVCTSSCNNMYKACDRQCQTLTVCQDYGCYMDCNNQCNTKSSECLPSCMSLVLRDDENVTAESINESDEEVDPINEATDDFSLPNDVTIPKRNDSEPTLSCTPSSSTPENCKPISTPIGTILSFDMH